MKSVLKFSMEFLVSIFIIAISVLLFINNDKSIYLWIMFILGITSGILFFLHSINLVYQYNNKKNWFTKFPAMAINVGIIILFLANGFLGVYKGQYKLEKTGGETYAYIYDYDENYTVVTEDGEDKRKYKCKYYIIYKVNKKEYKDSYESDSACKNKEKIEIYYDKNNPSNWSIKFPSIILLFVSITCYVIAIYWYINLFKRKNKKRKRNSIYV